MITGNFKRTSDGAEMSLLALDGFKEGQVITFTSPKIGTVTHLIHTVTPGGTITTCPNTGFWRLIIKLKRWFK